MVLAETAASTLMTLGIELHEAVNVRAADSASALRQVMVDASGRTTDNA